MRRRWVLRSLALAVALVAAVVLGGGWHYSTELVTPPTEGAREHAVTLSRPPEQVTVPGDVGGLPAWLVPGRGDTWVVHVHGRGATLREGLTTLRVAQRVGMPALAVEYRGAPRGPDSPDGAVHFGTTEWRDLESAVRWLARQRGARAFVLVGHSMGGAIVTQFLRHAPEADAVRGVVLDAPLLDMDATLALQTAERGIPAWLAPPVITTAKVFSTWRAGLDFAELQQVGWLARTDVPVLLFHGDDDHSVPVTSSRELARLGGAHVEYHECHADHVRCWNADPAAWEAAVSAFLQRVAR